MTGKEFGQWVEADGVVREVSDHRLVVVVPGGKLVVWLNELDKGTESALLGSLVRVCGVCAPVANNRNARLGIRLLVPSMEHVQVLKAVPENPFDRKAWPIARLLRWGSDRAAPGIQLAKTMGVVTYAESRLLFVQDGDSGLRVSLRNDALVEPGDRVEFVGFAEPDGLSAKLVQALVRKVGRSSLSPPKAIDLLDPDSSGLDATRRQIEARLVGRRANESYQILELRDEKTEMAFSAFFPTIHGILPSLPLGSRLRLQGVFKAEMDDLPDFGQAITSFQVYGNSPADVTILERPSWWTAGHTFWVVVALAAVLLACLAWLGLLRARVQMRTRELRTEIEERKLAEEALQSSQAQLQLQIERMPIACITWSPEFRVTSWNPAAEKIFGYAANETVGKHPYGLIVPKDAEPQVTNVWLLFAGR